MVKYIVRHGDTENSVFAYDFSLALFNFPSNNFVFQGHIAAAMPQIPTKNNHTSYGLAIQLYTIVSDDCCRRDVNFLCANNNFSQCECSVCVCVVLCETFVPFGHFQIFIMSYSVYYVVHAAHCTVHNARFGFVSFIL